ncbi:MAG: hypothetical protein AAGA48_05460 [Myxococcota bacterium]
MWMTLSMAVALADAPETPVTPASPERILVVGAPVRGSEPGWVAGLGDCLEERKSGAFQVIDRRDPKSHWAGLSEALAQFADQRASRLVVALASELAPENIDLKGLIGVFGRYAEAPTHVWFLFPLPIAPDRRGSAYQELSALVAKESALSILDPWKDAPKAESSASTSWLAEGTVTAAGEVRVASVACDAVLPRTP